MGKRGPKSAAEIATPAVPAATGDEIPDACYSLPDEAAAVWRATLAALPRGWIGPEAHPVLAAYCRTAIGLRRLGQLIHQNETEPGAYDLDRHTALLRAHGQQAQVLKTLATSLRLTPQTRLRAEKAATLIDGTPRGKRPWEV